MNARKMGAVSVLALLVLAIVPFTAAAAGNYGASTAMQQATAQVKAMNVTGSAYGHAMATAKRQAVSMRQTMREKLFAELRAHYKAHAKRGKHVKQWKYGVGALPAKASPIATTASAQGASAVNATSTGSTSGTTSNSTSTA